MEEEGEEGGGEEDGCNLLCLIMAPKTPPEERKFLDWERLDMVRSKMLERHKGNEARLSAIFFTSSLKAPKNDPAGNKIKYAIHALKLWCLGMACGGVFCQPSPLLGGGGSFACPCRRRLRPSHFFSRLQFTTTKPHRTPSKTPVTHF